MTATASRTEKARGWTPRAAAGRKAARRRGATAPVPAYAEHRVRRARARAGRFLEDPPRRRWAMSAVSAADDGGAAADDGAVGRRRPVARAPPAAVRAPPPVAVAALDDRFCEVCDCKGPGGRHGDPPGGKETPRRAREARGRRCRGSAG